MQSPNDRQVGGNHYGAAYQHWDLAADLELNYFEGQITKYVGRARKKNGLQDYEKGIHMLEKFVSLEPQDPTKQHTPLLARLAKVFGFDITNTEDIMKLRSQLAKRYCDENNLLAWERNVVMTICVWRSVEQLNCALIYMRDCVRATDSK